VRHLFFRERGNGRMLPYTFLLHLLYGRGVAMLELICQQRYAANGTPVDISPTYHNHGNALHTDAAPGRIAGQSAVQFSAADSRVWIAPNPKQGWSPIGELKIEVDARIAPHASLVQGLAAGDGSFEFLVSQTAIAVTIAGPTPTYVRSADAFSPDGKLHAVPEQRWATLGFHHDGFAYCRLFIDGQLVGQAEVSGAVAAVQAGGVVIGNKLGGGAPLQGAIDEVRIWRHDPNAVKKEFLGRPFTTEMARCWEAIFRQVQQWKNDHPGDAKALVDGIAAGEAAFLRPLLQLPEKDQTEFKTVVNDMLRLWCKGHLHGHEMEQAVRRWLKFLKQHHIEPIPPAFQEVKSLARGSGLNLDLDCDAAFVAFCKLLEREMKGVN
jgi:hypothetical protein